MTVVLVPRDGFGCRDGRGWYVDGNGGSRALPWPWPSTLRSAVCSAVGREREQAANATLTPEQWLDLKDTLSLTQTLPARRYASTRTSRDPTHAAWTQSNRMWPCPADGACFLPESSDEGDDAKSYAAFTRVTFRPTKGGATVLGGLDWELGQRTAGLALPFFEGQDPSKPTALPNWWPEPAFRQWLLGGPITLGVDRSTVQAHEPTERFEVHVAMQHDRGTAEDGALWSTTLREPLAGRGKSTLEWAIATNWLHSEPADAAAAAAASTVLLGGERRIARVDAAEDEFFAMPASLSTAVGEKPASRLRIMAVTPIRFPDWTWRPAPLNAGQPTIVQGPGDIGPVRLIGACTERCVGISGWALQGGAHPAKATRWFVPAGAVYEIERPDGQPFTKDQLEAAWLSSWGGTEEDLADGFCRVVAGLAPCTANK